MHSIHLPLLLLVLHIQYGRAVYEKEPPEFSVNFEDPDKQETYHATLGKEVQVSFRIIILGTKEDSDILFVSLGSPKSSKLPCKDESGQLCPRDLGPFFLGSNNIDDLCPSFSFSITTPQYVGSFREEADFIIHISKATHNELINCAGNYTVKFSLSRLVDGKYKQVVWNIEKRVDLKLYEEVQFVDNIQYSLSLPADLNRNIGRYSARLQGYPDATVDWFCFSANGRKTFLQKKKMLPKTEVVELSESSDYLALLSCEKIKAVATSYTCSGFGPQPTCSNNSVEISQETDVMQCSSAVEAQCRGVFSDSTSLRKIADAFQRNSGFTTNPLCEILLQNFSCSYNYIPCKNYSNGSLRNYLCSYNYELLIKYCPKDVLNKFWFDPKLIEMQNCGSNFTRQFPKSTCTPNDEGQLWRYIGEQNHSKSNKTCLAWHKSPVGSYYDQDLIDVRNSFNYCRHVYNESLYKPGCFVGNGRWEECSIPRCPSAATESPALETGVGQSQQTFMAESMDSLVLMCIIASAIVFSIAIVVGVFLYCRYTSTQVRLRPVDEGETPLNVALRANPKYAPGLPDNPASPSYPKLRDRLPSDNVFFSQHSSSRLSQHSFPFAYSQSQPGTLKRNILSSDFDKSPEFLCGSAGSLSRQSRLREIDVGLEYDRNKIIYVSDLGNGAFGRVFRAKVIDKHTKEQIDVAVKMLKEDLTVDQKEKFENEAKILANFSHPNIVKLRGVCREGSPFCMLLDYMKEGDLNRFLQKCNPSSNERRDSKKDLSNADLLMISQQVASGMSYVSEKHYVHRDLATRNCLVTDNLSVKIGDFGMSVSVNSEGFRQFSQSKDEIFPVRWMAPEAMLHHRYSKHSDVWSFGVLLWEVFTFALQPYYGREHEEIMQKVPTGELSLPQDLFGQEIPDDVYEVMTRCWNLEPARRPTFRHLYEVIDNLLKEYTSPPFATGSMRHSRSSSSGCGPPPRRCGRFDSVI